MKLNDAKSIAQSLRDYERRVQLIDAAYDECLERHPRLWLALTPADEWVLAESLEELVEKIQGLGATRGSSVIRFLNPDPMTLKL